MALVAAFAERALLRAYLCPVVINDCICTIHYTAASNFETDILDIIRRFVRTIATNIRRSVLNY